MSLSLSRNTLSKVRERGLSEYITLREDIALKDPLGEVSTQKAAASKRTISRSFRNGKYNTV